MEENVLKDFETFDEFPNKYLEVNKNCEYYYISKTLDTFIGKRKTDLITPVKIYNKEKLLMKESYYNVEDGSLILKTESLSNLDGSSLEFVKKDKNIKIIPIASILKEEDSLNLSKEDVKKIIKCDTKGAKTYIISLKN